jgi:hypothetical protein
LEARRFIVWGAAAIFSRPQRGSQLATSEGTALLNDLHTFGSKNSSYIALQAHENRVTVNVRVDCRATADLPGIGITPTHDQCLAFARHNIEAVREIAEARLANGDGEPEDWGGRPGLGIRIRDVDFAEYLSTPGKRLSLTAFEPHSKSTWIGNDGRFGAARDEKS